MMLDTGKLHFEFCYVVSVTNCYQFERTMYNFDSKNFMCMLLFVVVTFFFFRGVHHPEFPSVLTALEIDDPVVANCLIDMRGIEKILLIKVRLSPPYWPLKKGIVSLYSLYPVPPLVFVCDRQVEVW